MNVHPRTFLQTTCSKFYIIYGIVFSNVKNWSDFDQKPKVKNRSNVFLTKDPQKHRNIAYELSSFFLKLALGN